MDTTHGKRGHGLPQAAPLGAGPVADLILAGLKTVAKCIPLVTHLWESVPHPHLHLAQSQHLSM